MLYNMQIIDRIYGCHRNNNTMKCILPIKDDVSQKKSNSRI